MTLANGSRLPSTNVPDEHHLARYVKPRAVVRDNGQVAVIAEAFELREGEPTLSSGWLEHYEALGDRAVQIGLVIRDFRRSLDVKKSSAFAIGLVSEIRGACAMHRQAVRVLHEPIEPDFMSHAEVHRYSNVDELLDLLATQAWCEIVDNASIP